MRYRVVFLSHRNIERGRTRWDVSRDTWGYIDNSQDLATNLSKCRANKYCKLMNARNSATLVYRVEPVR